MAPTLNNEILGNNGVNPTLIINSGGSISGDSNVALNYPLVDQQVLQYNASTNKWINHVLTGQIPVGGLSNVLITNAQDNQTLLFNSSADEWENSFVPNPSLNNLTNCTIGSQGAITNPLVDQQILRYSSSTGNWSNSKDDFYNSSNANSSKSSLNGVNFVVVSPADKDVVMFNGTAGQFRNQPIHLSTDINNVHTSSLSNGDVIMYNTTNNRWQNTNTNYN